MATGSNNPWPATRTERRRWDWSGERPSGRADRLFDHYRSAIVPPIADATLSIGATAAAELDTATAAIAALDADPDNHLAGVAGALLRSESVGSSKIERLDIDARALGMAALGETRPKAAATQVWANVAAMEVAVAVADSTRPIEIDTILAIHRALMHDDPYEADSAGRLRTVQNWIGGSDACPRGALFVPPAPEQVPAAMADLAAFVNRTDLPVLAQAAIAHAQFETIHPHVDGNGRTGRALIHMVIRRRGLARRVIVPTSAALLADVDGYFAALSAYRAGDLDRYLAHVAAATGRAAHEAAVLGRELRRIRADWDARVRPRAGSLLVRLLDGLCQQPVISSTINGATGADPKGTHVGIRRLADAGVIVEVTSGRRNRVWVATEVTSALDEFARRIGPRQDGRLLETTGRP